ncbi:MAG: hypothetical protein OXG58_09030 [Gemmatimonadetes bacterium]|nr:hypothetical protein [Gemmatimonadota bacterium]
MGDWPPAGPAGLSCRVRFLDSFRDLVSAGFWTTEEGRGDLEYVPFPSSDGPHAAMLERLGLAGEDLA